MDEKKEVAIEVKEKEEEITQFNYWIGSQRRITTTISGAPYAVEFPEDASMEALGFFIKKIMPDIFGQMSETK